MERLLYIFWTNRNENNKIGEIIDIPARNLPGGV